jgi:biotin carboxyl carrier protein
MKKSRPFVFQRDLEKSNLLPLPGRLFVPIRSVLIIGTTILLFSAFVMVLPWQQTSKGEGRVMAYSPNDRPQKVSAPTGGRLARWFVVEGETVRIGDRIAEIVDLDQQLLERIDGQRNASQNKVAASRTLVSAAESHLERNKKLYQEGLVSKRELEQAQKEYAEANIDLATSETELAKIQIELSRQLSQIIKAPVNGVVISTLGGQGTAILKSGDTIAKIVPHTESRVAELFIDGNDMPLLKVGGAVRLQFEGWPAVQFSGAPDLAYGTFTGKILSIDPYDLGGGRFRIIVGEDKNSDAGIWPDPLVLRQGVRVKGWVLLEVVTVAYEIWRRMNGFPLKRTYAMDTDAKKAKDSIASDSSMGSGAQ